MKREVIVMALLVSAGVSRSVAGREVEEAPVRVTPRTCQVQSDAGDRVDLVERDGVLSVTYDVALSQYRRVGHRSFLQGSFRLVLREPVVLEPAQARVLFDAIGIGEGRALRPLVRDEAGEILSYEPHALWAPGLAARVPADKWVNWTSRSFWTSEAGGATQEIFDAAGGDGNARPDGALVFVGFEGRLLMDLPPEQSARAGAERRQGAFHLAEVRLGGVMVPDDDPTVFADAILSVEGRHRIGIEIRDEFQGVPYRQHALELEFDPADPVLARQAIHFDVGRVRNSWITCRVIAPGGSISYTEFRWEKNLPPLATSPPRVDMRTPPPSGVTRVNPDAHTNGVYREGEPLLVTVRVFRPRGGRTPARLRWILTPCTAEDVLERSERAIDFGGAEFVDVPVPLHGDGHCAYALDLDVFDAANDELDRLRYTLGIAPESIPPRDTRVGILRGREHVKRASYFRTTYFNETRPSTENAQVEDFIAMLDASSQMTSYVTYMIDLAEFEVLPGVYDFAVLDRLMDAAADRGCALTIRLAHSEQNAPYRWLPYTLPRSFDGEVIPGHRFYGAYSFADRAFIESWFRAFAAVHARYGKHPAFQGYYLMQPAGEWAFPDEPWTGRFAGYSWADAEAFRAYLRDERGLTIEELNARWSSTYGEWGEVIPPLPDFLIGTKPDLRPEWLDFSRYKKWTDEWWFPAVTERIRSFDPDHVIITYGGMQMNMEPAEGLVGKADYFHNGGNHRLKGEGALVKAWDEGRLGWITEPHHPHRWAAYGDPAERGWVLDWSVFVMTAQAGAGGANLHIYYMPNPTLDLAAHYGGAFSYDRFEKYKPILNELHGVTLQQPAKQVAVLQDEMTLLLKHRTVFASRLVDLRRWFELLTLDSVDHEFYRRENEDAYRMLVLNPLDEVISGETLDTAMRMTRRGALLVLSARTGRVCPDRDGSEYPLLRALGIAPPEGAYVTGEAGAAARVGDGATLFENGTSVNFYTQHDLHRELGDAEIGAHFWQWPYRWIPESDYFGYYRGVTRTGGRVIASFPDGGAAITLHHVGKGRALVFWGTPDMKPEALDGMMGRLAAAAGVVSPRAGNPIPYALEADHRALDRHYALLYHEAPGTYTQTLRGVPEGTWFVDDMVCDQRLGTYSGEELRDRGIELTYVDGMSPLKILRMIRKDRMQAPWVEKYRR